MIPLLPLLPLLTKIKFASIFGFIKQNWQAVGLVLLVSGAYFYVKSLKDENEDLQKQNTELKIEIAFCENNKAILSNAIKNQNGEITKWANVGKKAKAEFDNLKKELEDRRRTAETEVQRILQEEKPKTCQAAIDYLIKGTGEIKWQE